jgi:pimeloyl-ACP methyl ester carboxylesterase
MRALFVAALLLHALAHLVGFLVPWKLVTPRGRPAEAMQLFGGRVALGTTGARAFGIVWLLAGLGFAWIVIGWWRGQPWAGAALIAIVLGSLLLTAIWWPTARIGFLLNVGILLALTASMGVDYRRDIAAARNAAAASAVVQTSMGQMEYALEGLGDPVLSIHGTGGGWDQGLWASRALVPLGFQVIAPSRFGYLRTPWPAANSAADEADAFAALLDELRIQRVSVVSFSAGAAPAMQFALRHPDRVNALILVVPAAGGIIPPAAPPPPAWVMNFALRFDLPMWFTINYMPRTTSKIVAVPYALVKTLGTEEKAAYDETVQMLLPISARRQGLLMDARNQAGGEASYAIERISVPTLLVSADDDLYGTMKVARVAAERIPGAELLAFPTGGHLLMGREAETWPRVSEFIRRAQAQRPEREPRPVHNGDVTLR